MREQDKQLLADHYLDFYQIAFSILHNQTDVEDVVQEALVKTMAQPLLNDPYNYCAKAVRNNCMKLLRKSIYSLPRSLPEIAAPDGESDADIRIQQLWKLKDQLPPRIQKILNLYYVQGYSRDEIAQQTSTNITMVNKLFYLGHYRLKKQLLQLEEMEDNDK